MTLRKSIYLAIALGMAAALVACGGNNLPVIGITATSGGGQSTTQGTAFAQPLVATVTSNGSPANNVQVTFTAPPGGATCTFAGGGTSETDPTTNGVATSTTCKASTTAGGPYNVVASVAGASATGTFALTNTVGAAVGIEINSGSNQVALISGPYAAPLVATVFDSGGNGVPGIQVTFTAPTSGATGIFASNTSNTEIDTTDANGNATSTVFTANGTYGSFNVSADFTGDTGVASEFALTNSTTTVTAGNYVFSVSGTDAYDLPYTMAGVFTLTSDGIISGGEFDFTDYNVIDSALQLSPGQMTQDATGNFIATLNFTDPNTYINGTNGFVTLNGSMPSTTAKSGTLVEYDGWASGSGDINLQTSTTFCAKVPCSYAFYLSGQDWGDEAPTAVGGVITVDGAAATGTTLDTISGTGSIYDVNDGGTLIQAGTFVAAGSTVSSTADTFGLVTFSLALNGGSGTVSPVIDAYMIDANHFRLVEQLDNVLTAGGAATAQSGAGGFSSSSIGGDTYVFGVSGQDGNGVLQSAGAIGFDSSDANITGNVSFDDIGNVSPQGGTTVSAGTFAVDQTGDVTVAGIADSTPTFTYNFQMYLTGDGHAYVISMDNTPYDVQAGRATIQATSLTAASFTGTYSLDLTQIVSGGEQDGTGPISADGTSAITGTMDFNMAPLTPTAGLALAGTFAIPSSSPNGVWTGTITDPVSAGTDNVTYYIIDTTQGVVIENDTNQLTLGYYTNN